MGKEDSVLIERFDDLASLADYSLMKRLSPDPQATEDGEDYYPREVFSGHYVPVKPTPIRDPQYITHSKRLFAELGFSDALAESDAFMRMFSGDLSSLPEPMSKVGWATGYALSIYGTEYYRQCPFGTGNGYGDGRAISVLEGVFKGKRREMQLKGAGRTPFCRGADGRAVLRSSIREFLAQEHMYALGVPTSRSLSLFVSASEQVQRPWYSDDSRSKDPDMMVSEYVAISTRVAPSFLRVGQIELFGRRARKKEHPQAMQELEAILLHLIEREYSEQIEKNLALSEKIVSLAEEFSKRLTALVADWIRVGYCQGNFNSDNCAAGGFTLDYGPFGFMELFNPEYQPWTGGGKHFSFFNQPRAAYENFKSFCSALEPLLVSNKKALIQLGEIQRVFPLMMQKQMEKMWASKLGIEHFDAALLKELFELMMSSYVDYTIFFRELSQVPETIEPLQKSFYGSTSEDKRLLNEWAKWLEKWRSLIDITSDSAREALSRKMKALNPKYILREWHLVFAYQAAKTGDYTLIKTLQEVMDEPYAEHSKEVERQYYRRKPTELFNIGGISHLSCSS